MHRAEWTGQTPAMRSNVVDLVAFECHKFELVKPGESTSRAVPPTGVDAMLCLWRHSGGSLVGDMHAATPAVLASTNRRRLASHLA